MKVAKTVGVNEDARWSSNMAKFIDQQVQQQVQQEIQRQQEAKIQEELKAKEAPKQQPQVPIERIDPSHLDRLDAYDKAEEGLANSLKQATYDQENSLKELNFATRQLLKGLKSLEESYSKLLLDLVQLMTAIYAQEKNSFALVQRTELLMEVIRQKIVTDEELEKIFETDVKPRFTKAGD